MFKTLLCLLVATATTAVSQSSWALMSSQDKKSWSDRLQACTSDCAALAAQFANVYQNQYQTSIFNIKKDAKTTLLYMHSYTLNPFENVEFLKKEAQRPDLNVVALVFTAHDGTATPEDYKKVTPQDWLLDAELGLNLATALQKKVVIEGFSMGGLLAANLAYKYPNKVSKIVLLAPALMIKSQGEKNACSAQSSFVQSLAKSFVSNVDPTYLEKYLNGACALAHTMQTIRGQFEAPIAANNPFNNGSKANTQYMDDVDAEKKFAAAITTPTFLVYSADDEAVDHYALEGFTDGLKNVKKIIYDKDQHRGHMGMLRDTTTFDGSLTTFQQIDQFIN